MKFEVHKEELLKQFPELKLSKDWYIFVGEKKDYTRSDAQNKSLHKMFSDLSKDCLEKGIEMRDIVSDNIPIPCTPENLKWLWKRVQKKMYGTKSTTQLKKIGEIDGIYDTMNKLLIERTNGEISMPEFPNKEAERKNFKEIEYPENDLGKCPF